MRWRPILACGIATLGYESSGWVIGVARPSPSIPSGNPNSGVIRGVFWCESNHHAVDLADPVGQGVGLVAMRAHQASDVYQSVRRSVRVAFGRMMSKAD